MAVHHLVNLHEFVDLGLHASQFETDCIANPDILRIGAPDNNLRSVFLQKVLICVDNL